MTGATAENELSPEKFIWEKYCAKRGWSISQLVEDFSPLRLKPDVRFVGWCRANRLPVRPRAFGLAVMVEIDGEETWLHGGFDVGVSAQQPTKEKEQ